MTKQPQTCWLKIDPTLFNSWFCLAVLFVWAGLTPVFAVSWQDIWQLAEVIGQLGHVCVSLSSSSWLAQASSNADFKSSKKEHALPHRHFLNLCSLHVYLCFIGQGRHIVKPRFGDWLDSISSRRNSILKAYKYRDENNLWPFFCILSHFCNFFF